MAKYKLKGHTLEQTNDTKYLGVNIEKDLSWTSHINRATKKASSMIGFLQRNLRVSNKATKTNAYKTLVCPHLEYCSTVWSPHTADKIKQIEAVQRRAARYATNCYENTCSVTALLNDLK